MSQLKEQYKAGFGSQWADMEILRINQIPVIGTVKYSNLFRMLSAKRFDYFPRGINEIWQEVSTMKDSYPNLAVEPKLALYYPYPVYFFVNKANEKLANRLERGLKIAIADGTFKALFLKYHQAMIKQASLQDRRLFTLENPTLAKDTLKPDTSWWLEN